MSHQPLMNAILAAIQTAGYRLNETLKEKVEILSYAVVDENDEMQENDELASMQSDDDDEDEE